MPEWELISEQKAKELNTRIMEQEPNYYCSLCGWIELEYFAIPGSQEIRFRCKRCGNRSVVQTYLSKTHLVMSPPETPYSRWLKEGMPGVHHIKNDGSGMLKLTCRKGHTSRRDFDEEAEFICDTCKGVSVDNRVKIEIDTDY